MSSVVEVLLLKDVQGLGQFGQKRQVKAGYARNFLFPQAVAVLASKQNEAWFQTFRVKEDKRRAAEKADAEQLAQKVNGLTLEFTSKTHDGGKLYGSVSVSDILAAIQEKSGLELEKKQIQLEEGFKEVGQFEVTLSLHHDVQAKVTVNIQAEK